MTDWQLWREDFAQGYCDLMANKINPAVSAWSDAYFQGVECARRVKEMLKCWAGLSLMRGRVNI